MIAPNTLKVSIVIGDGSHAPAVVDDLRARAMTAVPSAWTMNVEVVQVTSPGDGDTPSGPGTIRLPADRPIPGAALSGVLAGKSGPVGVVGRLIRDNLESRRVATSLARRKDVVSALLGSAVVVAADTSADRAVWQLRKRTGAHLVHGPAAMVHAIRELSDS